MPREHVSMADVARRVGVSAQTVSRVVNDSPRVDPATRARVEDAMAALGYRPHRAARALRTGRTHTVGVIAQTLSTVGNSRMLESIAAAAAAQGYAVTLVTTPGQSDVADAFARLGAQGVDGAIVLNEASALARTAGWPADLAIVAVDAPAGENYSVVRTDHAAGARLATEHLLTLGHESVHHLAGPENSFAAAERARGWADALSAAGRDRPLLLQGDWSAASGARAAQDLPPSATAVFAANDQMALGVMSGLAAHGRRVPHDVAVVGFDDVIDAAYFSPALTTVRQNFDRLGSAAVSLLLGQIAGGECVNELHLPELIVRASTGASGA